MKGIVQNLGLCSLAPTITAGFAPEAGTPPEDHEADEEYEK